MVNGNAQASTSVLVITQLSCHYKSIDTHFDQALVVLHGLEALYFDVIGLQELVSLAYGPRFSTLRQYREPVSYRLAQS